MDSFIPPKSVIPWKPERRNTNFNQMPKIGALTEIRNLQLIMQVKVNLIQCRNFLVRPFKLSKRSKFIFIKTKDPIDGNWIIGTMSKWQILRTMPNILRWKKNEKIIFGKILSKKKKVNFVFLRVKNILCLSLMYAMNIIEFQINHKMLFLKIAILSCHFRRLCCRNLIKHLEYFTLWHFFKSICVYRRKKSVLFFTGVGFA